MRIDEFVQSVPNLTEASQNLYELIKSGKVGTLVWGQGYYCRNNKGGEWNYDVETESTAANIDWERWLGPVKTRAAFDPEHFHRWRKYTRYCAGLLGDLVPHRLHPLVLASGNPRRITRRAKNKIVGRALARAGVWRMLWK